MIPASNKQKQIIAILTKNDKELKAAFVVQQTCSEFKKSTSDLTHAQANNIIVQLGGKPLLYDNWAYFDKTKASHLNIISLAIQYGYSVPSERYGEIADLGRLSEWLKHQAPVKERMLSMSPKQISKTISALENMVAQKFKS